MDQPTYSVFECGCGTKTVLTIAGGTLNECGCPEDRRTATTTVTYLYPGETRLIADVMGTPVG